MAGTSGPERHPAAGGEGAARRWEQDLRALVADRRSGAAEIAREASRLLGEVPPEALRRAVEALLRSHPSMAPLWRLGTEVLSPTDPRAGADRFLQLLEADRGAAAALAPVLPERVLTISWSSSVREALALRRPGAVACLRSEPGGEGARMAEALAAVTPRAVVVEDQAGLAQLPAEAVVVGADAVTPRAVVNKVGTRALAEAARRRGIPCFAVAGEAKLVAEDLPVARWFEPTPIELFTGVALPGGVLPPAAASTRAGRRPIHPSLRPLLEELRSAPAPP